MSGITSVAAVALAAVLLWAAGAKLMRPAETASDFRQLGVPAPGLLARVVPLVEIGTAILLVVAPGWGGVVGFALLSGFTALLVAVIRSGRVVACGCFGSSSTEPVSIVEIARNGLLLLLAAAAASSNGLVRPTLPDVVAVSTSIVIGLLLLQLLALSRVAGGLFGAELAGELGADQ